ncbi:MAG: hypothetical protein EA385_17370, partial [Salinarimonadaceae bacterium]
MNGQRKWAETTTPGVRIVALLGVVIAATIQILTTVQIGATPIRIALSDIVLPAGALIALVAFIAARWRRPNWVVPHLDLLLCGFLVWLGISCFIGWQRSGVFIAWAWGPKYIGFGVLMGYLVVGALVAEAGEKARNAAALAFMTTAWVISLSALARFFIEINGALPFGAWAFRAVGFSENPNAFAFLLGTALILQLLAGP